VLVFVEDEIGNNRWGLQSPSSLAKGATSRAVPRLVPVLGRDGVFGGRMAIGLATTLGRVLLVLVMELVVSVVLVLLLLLLLLVQLDSSTALTRSGICRIVDGGVVRTVGGHTMGVAGGGGVMASLVFAYIPKSNVGISCGGDIDVETKLLRFVFFVRSRGRQSISSRRIFDRWVETVVVLAVTAEERGSKGASIDFCGMSGVGDMGLCLDGFCFFCFSCGEEHGG